MRDDSLRLDLTKLPRRIELELSPALLERLATLSGRTGRSVRDLAEQIIHAAAADKAMRSLAAGFGGNGRA